MCGIAGIINLHLSNEASLNTEGGKENGSILRQRLQRMTDALQHRGPNGEGCWVNSSGNVFLGHRRLSIIDLSDAAAQPMHYLDRYTIIHNGEIYNYLELKDELQKKGYSFHSQSDTEVILASYDCWEEECVDHFDGMFAFAIWDEKEKELFAARDRFGEKPFFYYFDEERLLFGSEMKALWAAGIARVPNLKMLFNFITIGYVDNPNDTGETFFEKIHKLPAATSLKYSAPLHEIVLEKYWDIDPEKQHKKIKDDEAIGQFNHLFTVSVKRRLRSDVPVGTSLSGGLDSGSIAALLHRLGVGGEGYKCFTAIFPAFERDESVFSKQVADAFDLQQFTATVSADTLLDDWEKLSYHQEEPFGSASIYAQYKVFETAAQQGVKVLLDGQGADEILAGYHKYYKWYWQELFRQRKLLRSKELSAAYQGGVGEKFGLKNIIASYFPDYATVVLERQYLLKALQHKDLSKEFVRSQSKEAYYTTPAHFTLNGALYFNTCTHGLEELLRYADRNAMTHGREVRLPFLSHELVEFIFSLPAHFKIRDGWTKWLLRKTMDRDLPPGITWRRDKVGFEPPQKNWMEESRVQEAIQEAKKTLVKEGVLKPGVLQKKIQPQSAYDANSFDWRYFSAATLFK